MDRIKKLKREYGLAVLGYAAIVAVVWSITVGVLLLWSVQRQKEASKESARISARAQFDKDVLYRRWNASHGGVYVPVTEITRPNPYLTNRKKRDVETSGGKRLTLINPAYMTRQVHELGFSTAGMRGHITSLKPIRPANAADPWERDALEQFEKGTKERSSIEVLDGVDQMRLMKPLMVEPGCLKCHSEQGYKVGEVRGGISVAVPMRPYVEIMRREVGSLAWILGGIWVLGLAATIGAARHFHNRTVERERSRLELHHSEEQLALVLHGSGLGSWDWDIPNNKVRFNERWAEMKGYRNKEILPQMESWQQLIHADDLPEVRRKLRLHLEGKSAGYEAEFRMRTKTGGWIWILDRGRVMDRDPSGRPIRVCGTHLDITGRKQMEQELQQAQKLESVGQLASGIAHEINTPIQFVGDNLLFMQEAFDSVMPVLDQYGLLVQKLKEKPSETPPLETLEAAVEEADLEFLKEEMPTSIEQSIEGTQRVSKIVEALKEFAHPGGKSKDPANLNEAIETTITIAVSEWKYVADLVTDFEDTLPLVPCLVSEFNQVILNLIINAKDAIAERGAGSDPEPARGKITIRTRHDEKWAIITVEDTGMGMSEKVKSRIFEPFYTTKEVGKGSGQGLAIARSVIVDKHDGRLTVHSQVGKGTVFEIKLPLADGTEST